MNRTTPTKWCYYLDGYQIHHNYVRPHSALDGRTPAEAWGIEIKGDNKWITVIQNANRK